MISRGVDEDEFEEEENEERETTLTPDQLHNDLDDIGDMEDGFF
jgi:hypothetical protein